MLARSVAAVTPFVNRGRDPCRATDGVAALRPKCADSSCEPRRLPRLPPAPAERRCSDRLYRLPCQALEMKLTTPPQTRTPRQAPLTEQCHGVLATTPRERRGMD